MMANLPLGTEVGDEGFPLSERLPVLPLRDIILFPGLVVPVHVVTAAGQRVVDLASKGSQYVLALGQRNSRADHAGPGDCYDVGTVARIGRSTRQLDDSYETALHGIAKVRIVEAQQQEGYWEARVEAIAEDQVISVEVDAMVLNLNRQFERYVRLSGVSSEALMAVRNAERPMRVAYLVTAFLTLTVPERQTILEIPDASTALERVTFYLTRTIERLELGQEIQDRVRAGMDRKQREFYLREQLQAIKRELGEADAASLDLQELTLKLDETEMPQEARKAAEKELERLGRMSPASAEYTVSRNYLDWLLEVPWSIGTTDNLDVRQAAGILDEDHFDLEKVKRRILEYLAVLQLKKEMKGPILCFVGPPGVGKTSLGQSIARSLGRKFVRISLGGMRDEAEIRGHRRTYVGSLPGRVIQGLRRAGSNNPVFVLDEIDKLGMDFRGDPSSALLEVLDPEQNSTFSDHYLGVAFDLSKVMFIATANMLDPVPPALKDRMEVIEIPGYTEEEKLEIARRYLWLQQIDNHGLNDHAVSISDEGLLEIIRSHTREAGVRNLNRTIASVCRHVAKNIAEGQSGPVKVELDDLPEVLGPVKFLPETATRSWGPGIATGLAWTPVGGELIFVETLRTSGAGRLILTGQLGEVMKESATAALTYIRAHASDLGIEDEKFERSDIHVHVPAGGIPKDGPSAGVALVVVLASLMTGRLARREVAMTGEITLRGDILPVGGVKEKVLAARRAGIREVILPQTNAKDLVDIPKHLQEGMTFREVQTISELLECALEPTQG
ncbi:MAG: endopeptidase La [Syntrophobacteraceae bacterium]